VVLHYGCVSEQAIIKKLVSLLNKSTGEVVKSKPRQALLFTYFVISSMVLCGPKFGHIAISLISVVVCYAAKNP
jgi:hypothetical protein